MVHSGVQQFVRWVDKHRERLRLKAPATGAQVADLEQALGMPLPEDLKQVLFRFNGGDLPSGELLSAGTGDGTMEALMRELGSLAAADVLDAELLLPFHNSGEGSILCFDRTSGPLSDTWPVVDYYEDTGEIRLVYRTFDGWCRASVAEWTSPDFGAAFCLDTYLRQGERHAHLEPDVSTAHATAAHGYRRAGRPEDALHGYLRAARCVPALPWCDWEALKLAVLLVQPSAALEAATRLSSPAPPLRWAERETTPAQVAVAIGRIAGIEGENQPWVRLLDQLLSQAQGHEVGVIHGIKDAIANQRAVPPPPQFQEDPVVPPRDDLPGWWKAARQAYAYGALRDDDLVLDPALDPLRSRYDFQELLAIRREF